MRQPGLVAGHPVDVAAHGVDLAVVGEHAERLRQPPGREGVGRVALVVDREIRDEALVGEVGIERRDLLGQEHALVDDRSEEHTSELQSLMRISYAVFCLKKKKKKYLISII